MTLEEIERQLIDQLAHLDRLGTIKDGISFDDYLKVYEVLAQVKQAQHLEHIDSTLDGMNHWVQLISHRLDDMHMDG